MAATAGDGTLLLKAGSGDAVMTTQRITDDLERLLALLPDPCGTPLAGGAPGAVA